MRRQIRLGLMMVAVADISTAWFEECDYGDSGCVNVNQNPLESGQTCGGDDGGGGSPPPPPVAVGGFSSGSWGGSPLPSSQYTFGIVDAASGGYWCDLPGAQNPHFAGAADTLNNGSQTGHAFWYLTSNYYARNTCGLATTPQQWGIQQAAMYKQVLDQVTTCCLDTVFGDIELLAGDWEFDSFDNNRAVISSVFYALCHTHIECGNGIYSSRNDFPQIVGEGAYFLNTTQIWMASYGPNQQQLNSQQQYFTTAPGGYYVYTWQYTDDDCYLSHSTARNLASSASPFIPRFDRWTNTQPNLVC